MSMWFLRQYAVQPPEVGQWAIRACARFDTPPPKTKPFHLKEPYFCLHAAATNNISHHLKHVVLLLLFPQTKVWVFNSTQTVVINPQTPTCRQRQRKKNGMKKRNENESNTGTSGSFWLDHGRTALATPWSSAKPRKMQPRSLSR